MKRHIFLTIFLALASAISATSTSADTDYQLHEVPTTGDFSETFLEGVLPHISGSKHSWVKRWRTIKNIADHEVYASDPDKTTFYCKCKYISNYNYSGSDGISESCEVEFTTRYNRERRGKWVEWEHVVPRSYFSNKAEKYSEAWIRMATDMHNIVPSIGAVNGERGAKPYGVAKQASNAEHWEGCPGVSFTQNVFEPSDKTKPVAARISMYMYEKYDLEISPEQTDLFKGWCKLDNGKRSAWEIERNERIRKIQGDSNRFVDGTKGCDSFMEKVAETEEDTN